MRRIISSILAFSMLVAACPLAFAEDSETQTEEVEMTSFDGYVSSSEGVKIAGTDTAPVIYVDSTDHEGVIRAAADLKTDIETVSGQSGEIVNENSGSVNVLVGTIGNSAEIDKLISEEKLDVSEIQDKWESFTIQNIDDVIVIAGSDKRGTIFGIYDMSEKMGISPWSWWADVKPEQSDNICINLDEGGYTEGEPSVQYRGIFMNDEFNLTTWSTSLDASGNMNNATYKKIFELLLRLKANYMWPAMHTYSISFNNTENNAALANEYGIVMGSSHAEPLLRNNLGELYNFQQKWMAENPDKKLYINEKDDAKREVSYMWTSADGDGNAVDNKEFLTDYWRERAAANGSYENTYTLGMRGVHDGKFNTNMDSKTAMTEIIATQRSIIEEEICDTDKTLEEVPQVFIPYKEMLNLYNDDLEIPEDVTLMWPDDNFGYIRQYPTEAERQRIGGAGIYYHLSYYGRPTSYLWLTTSQLGLIREEMTKAYDTGAKKIWIANIGDIKPAENHIEYFLDLARDIETVRNTPIEEYTAKNAKRDFGFDEEKAAEYADIQNSFYEMANSKRPEHLKKDTFSLTNFGDEGQRYVDEYKALVSRSEALYDTLSEDKKPSFFELQLYPLRSACNLAVDYVNADKAALYKKQGRGSAVNKYAQKANTAASAIAKDTVLYNTMLDGKWDKIMSLTPTGLANGSFGGHVLPNLNPDTIDEVDYTDMGVAVEGQVDSTLEMTFDYYNQRAKFIDVYNTGLGTINYKISSDVDWIKFSRTEGTVHDDDRIYAMADYSVAPSGNSSAKIVVTQYIGSSPISSKIINVTLSNDVVADLDEKTYVEAENYVSIEAENFTNNVVKGEYEWKVEDNFGRSGDSVKIYPDTAAAVTTPNKDNSAYLEYQVYFKNSGTYNIDLYRMPTLNSLGTLRCNVGIDDATPVRFAGNNTVPDSSTGTDAWGKGVLQNIQVISSTINVPSEGLHTVRLYNENAGVVVDKMVLTYGAVKSSYYGAPESYNTTYNNEPQSMPEAVEPSGEQTGDITTTFDATLITSDIETDNSQIEIGENSMTITITDTISEDGIGVIAAYNSDGTLKDMAVSTNTISKDDETKTLNFDKAVTGDRSVVYVWDNLNNMKPLTSKININLNKDSISAINVVKVKEMSSAIALVAMYDINGELIDNNFTSVDLSEVAVNSAVNIPLEIKIPNNASTMQVILFDDFEHMNVLAPIYKKSIDSINLMASYDNDIVTAKTNLNDYIGKQSMALITPEGATEITRENIIYVGQEKVTDESYKSIPCSNLGEKFEGKYTLKIAVEGEKLFEESFNTAKNIQPDVPATENTPYSWNFDTDQTGTGNNVPVIGGNAIYDSTYKAIQMTSSAQSGGSLTVDFDKAVSALQGEKLTVVAKIAYGDLSSKFMNYELIDSNGKAIISSKINRYTGKTQSVKIGDVEQLEDTSKYPPGLPKIDKNTKNPTGRFATYTTVIDFAANEITIAISNNVDATVTTYTGKLPADTSYDIDKMSFTTDYDNASRSCYVDDISITKSTADAYTMTFEAVDAVTGATIENATVTVNDGRFSKVIEPIDGAYKLCEGVYNYTVSADGYETVTEELELSQATLSKNIVIQMNAN